MTTKAKILSFLLILVGSLNLTEIYAQNAKLGQSYEPIISHELSLNIPFLLSLSAMEKDSRKLGSQEEANQLYSVTQDAVKNQGEQDGKIATNNTLYKDQLALLQYFMSHTQLKENRDRIKGLGEQLERSAATYAELSKNPSLASQAQFYSKLGKFIRTDGTDGISDLIPLKDKLKDNKDMITSIDLLVGYSLAMSPATAVQGLQTINKISNEVSIYGRIAIKLSEALSEYGLDADGAPLSTVKPTAEGKLIYTVQLARGMPIGLQHLVMNSAAFIWTKANQSATARVPSFLKEGFPGIAPVDFLRERDALIELQAQNYKLASGLYKKIAEAYPKGDAQLAAIDARIWELDLLVYQKSQNLGELEASFTILRTKYANQGKKGFWGALGDSYRKVLDQSLDTALNPKATKPQQTMAIQFTSKYLKTESERPIAYGLKSKIALLYRSMKMYNEAVETYLDIAKDQPLKNYLFAIEAQSQLANWPAQPDFADKSKEKLPERTKLLSIYETVSTIKNGDDWTMLAHIGLLQRSLGNVKGAEALWVKGLRTNPNNKFAMEAGGLLLNEFFEAKRWDDVVDMSHLFASKKVNPTVKGAVLNYKPLLADALFKGGTEALAKNNFQKAVKYLEEFSIVFPSEPRFASAGHSLAFAYKGLNKLVPALNVCKNITEKFPKYPLRAKLILQASDWAAADRNTWEYAFYFYQKYLADYKNETNVPQIRVMAAELYFKRKLYGWASRLYTDQSMSAKVPKDLQLKGAVRAMEIEDQFGEAKTAYSSAQRIIELSGPTDPARYHAFAFMGRYVANSKDLKAMNDIEPKLLAISKNSKEVLESIGYIRYRRAEILGKVIVNNENNLQLRDPEGTVKKYYGRFEDERKNYLNVCQVGITSYCAPAMLKLTTIAKQALDAIEKIQIAETLGPNRVNSFKVFKQLQVSKVQQSKKDYGDQALRLAKQGTTTPSWKEEITKSLEYEEGMAH
ncbi:MAG: hypothetical protein EOP07_06505 [Proteobacteria bacterium]|nr:MAG: hypothetical protein EOP07_06505 [Pseudomonadota bacterium]